MVAPANGCHSGLCNKIIHLQQWEIKTHKKLWLISELINVYEAKTFSMQTQKMDKVLSYNAQFLVFVSKNGRDGNFLSLTVFSVGYQSIIY